MQIARCDERTVQFRIEPIQIGAGLVGLQSDQPELAGARREDPSFLFELRAALAVLKLELHEARIGLRLLAQFMFFQRFHVLQLLAAFLLLFGQDAEIGHHCHRLKGGAQKMR